VALEPALFADVADALGIAHPAIVEKDYYAVQLLKLLADIDPDGYTLLFAGGTCLAKAHRNTYRMSEDIDIKFIPNDETLKKSRSEQRRLRRKLNQHIAEVISASEIFNIIGKPHIQNEYKFQQLSLEYPTYHGEMEALRPHIQLELTESMLFQKPRDVPLSSLYAEVTKQENEVDIFSCVELESIAAEKFIALLRRTAALARDHKKKDDQTLVRHVYDLHLIYEGKIDLVITKSLVQKVIKIDVEQFGNQHPEFRENPIDELLLGFETLKKDPISRQRYVDFIGPLVFHPNPADWQTAFKSLEVFVEKILRK